MSTLPNHDRPGGGALSDEIRPLQQPFQRGLRCIFTVERDRLPGNHVLGENHFLAADVRKVAQRLGERLIGYVKVKAAVRCLADRCADHTHRADSGKSRCRAHPWRPNDHSTPSLVIVDSPQ